MESKKMFRQLSAKELKDIYADRPWINKNALTNLVIEKVIILATRK